MCGPKFRAPIWWSGREKNPTKPRMTEHFQQQTNAPTLKPVNRPGGLTRKERHAHRVQRKKDRGGLKNPAIEKRYPPSKPMVCDDRFSHVKPDRHRVHCEKPKTAKKVGAALREKKRPKKRFDSTLGYPGEGPVRAKMPTCALCELGVTCKREQHGHTSGKPKLGAAKRLAEKKAEPTNPRYYPCQAGLECENLDCHYHRTARHKLVEARRLEDDGIEAKSTPQGPGKVQVAAADKSHCFEFRDTGDCRFGDECWYKHSAVKEDGGEPAIRPSAKPLRTEAPARVPTGAVAKPGGTSAGQFFFRGPCAAKSEQKPSEQAEKKGGFNDHVVPATAEIKVPLPPVSDPAPVDRQARSRSSQSCPDITTSSSGSTVCDAPAPAPASTCESKWGGEAQVPPPPAEPDPLDAWEPGPYQVVPYMGPPEWVLPRRGSTQFIEYQLVEVPLHDSSPPAPVPPAPIAPSLPAEAKTHRRAIFVRSSGQEYEAKGRFLSVAGTTFWLRSLFKKKRRMFCHELSNPCLRQYKAATTEVVDGFFSNTIAWFSGKGQKPIRDPQGCEQLRLNFFEGVFDLVYIGKVYTQVTQTIMLDQEFCGKRVLTRDGNMNVNLPSYVGATIAREFKWALSNSETYANTINFCVNRLFLREKDATMAMSGQIVRDPLNRSRPPSKVCLNGGVRLPKAL